MTPAVADEHHEETKQVEKGKAYQSRSQHESPIQCIKSIECFPSNVPTMYDLQRPSALVLIHF